MLAADSTEMLLVSNGINNVSDVDEYYRGFGMYDEIFWEAPRLGNRIPYVIVRGKGDVNNRSEDPRMVGRGVKIDVAYYINNQLKNPLVTILEHVMENPGALFEDYIRRAVNVNKGRREITSFFKRQKC